jgi:hypothetical protein
MSIRKFAVCSAAAVGILLAAGAEKASASEAASATITLQSITGTQATPVYNYAMTLNDTGTTNIGTFWFAWVPGQDFLDTPPTSASDPTNWSHIFTGSGNGSDGKAIQWVAASGDAITPGNSLSGFDFSTLDSPTKIDGMSASHPSTAVETSFVYIAGPETDPGFEFSVAPVTVPEPMSIGVLLGGMTLLGIRRPRRA